MKRPAIGKRLRFEVFARDGFTCRYCGIQSDKAQLEIDHVVPVCKGGTNDLENLATACFDCNRGKAGNPIEKITTSEGGRLALMQDMQEQLSLAKAAKATARARLKLKQSVVNFFCEARGTESAEPTTIEVLMSYVQKHGPAKVFEWIGIAAMRLPRHASDKAFGKYISGIRRKDLNGE